MNRLYIKDGVVKLRNKIMITDGNTTIANPSHETLLANGWQEYVAPEPTPIPIDEQYRQRVVNLVREQYSVDDELAILRQRDTKVEEFNQYNTYVEECKARAREELGI